MAVEAKRGCGYRKVGGLYLVSDGLGVACDRLPIPLHVCPTCGAGIKQSRGWTWIDVNGLVGGMHRNCADNFACPLCMATSEIGKAGLLWIGEKFYKTPELFEDEAKRQGISRRIHAVPRGFKVGETWVLLAHSKGAVSDMFCECGHERKDHVTSKMFSDTHLRCGFGPECGCRLYVSAKAPGIFHVFRPSRIEKIVTESMAGDGSEMTKLRDAGIAPVIVPDDDPDHQGSVYDDEGNGSLFQTA